MAKQQRILELRSSELIAPRVKHLAFAMQDGSAMPFVPGQFLSLHFLAEDKPHGRSYSIASRDSKGTLLEIAVAYVDGGLASDVLFDLKPGDTLPVTGPYGRLILKEEPIKRYVLVGTGTGIAPYRAMLNEIAARPSVAVDVVQGVRDPSELIYGEEFAAFALEHPHFQYHACFSQQPPTEPRSFEHVGRVLGRFDALNLNPADDIIYLCGNPNMIDDAFAWLTARGFDHKNVRREKYVFSH
jgi:ferredoxin-NADP reductase